MAIKLKPYTYAPRAAGLGTVIIPGRYFLEDIITITNVTRNIIIYDLGPAEYLGTTASFSDGNTTITLAVNTSSHSPTDKLQVFVEDKRNASSGYVFLNDGILPDGSVGSRPGSIVMGLTCSQRAFNRPSVISSFSKTIRRIAPSKNPTRSAKMLVSQYAGCDEASLVRNRIVAMSRIRLSVSGEEFRFRVPE